MSLSPHVPELAALHVLVAVARLGSMGAAAAELGLSQQAVSARVRAAETQLGLALFVRSPRGVALTAAGRSVITWADEVLTAASELDEKVANLRGNPRSGARVAVSNTVSECLFPQWAAQLRRENPTARITAQPGNSEDVLAAVRAGETDLGFVECPTVPREVASCAVARDELVVVVPPGHSWTRARSPVTAAHLAATALIVREPGSGTRSTFEESLRRAGHVPVAPAMELGSTASVRSAVLAMGAPAVLSSLAVKRDVQDGRLVTIEVADLKCPRTLRAVWNRNQRPTGVAADLLRIAQQVGEGNDSAVG